MSNANRVYCDSICLSTVNATVFDVFDCSFSLSNVYRVYAIVSDHVVSVCDDDGLVNYLNYDDLYRIDHVFGCDGLQPIFSNHFYALSPHWSSPLARIAVQPLYWQHCKQALCHH